MSGREPPHCTLFIVMRSACFGAMTCDIAAPTSAPAKAADNTFGQVDNQSVEI
jgi:hypothetical protein